MADEAGSELVAVIREHLNEVKQALSLHSNMDKTLKEEAVNAVSEMDSLLNKLGGMFLSLECMLKKALTTGKERPCRYRELLATSPSTQAYLQNKLHPVVQPNDCPPPTGGLIVKVADPNTSSHKAKRLIKEAVDPKALKLWVSKLKNLANNRVLVECKSKTGQDILEKELSKLCTVTIELPKRKLPTLLLMYVPKDVEDDVIKDTILHQNNLSLIEDPVLNIKFTKRTFEDSRHIVVEVSPNLRRELVALRKIKLHWNMCKVEDFVIVTRSLNASALATPLSSAKINKNALTVLRTTTGKNVAISTKLDAPIASKQTLTSTTWARN